MMGEMCGWRGKGKGCDYGKMYALCSSLLLMCALDA